jgi:two-component system OmpR family response regulator
MIRILVIDDEPDFSDLILKYFSAMGCSVDVAATGEQGLERVTEISPDILIVDNRLPGIDGIEVVRRLRAAKQDVFIVMVTIDKEDGVRAALYPFAVDRFLKKPFQFSVLNDTLIEMIAAAKDRKKGHKL